MSLSYWLFAELFRELERMEARIMAVLERLEQEVAETTSITQSAIVLIEGLAEKVRQLEPTQEAIDALADELDMAGSNLAAAVTANTPADEEPEPPLEEEPEL